MPALDRGGQTVQGPQTRAHAEPDHQSRARQQQQERREVAESDVGAHPQAHVRGLRDLYDSVAGVKGEQPPGPIAPTQIGESAPGRERQFLIALRYVQQAPASIPDLHQKVAGAVAVASHGQGEQILIAQRQRGLLQLIVEQGVGFGAGLSVSREAGGGQHER